MIQTFRRFFQSKIGIFVTLAFLGVIAFAFASSDVANTGTFGGVAGGDRVAVVGDEKISAIELSQAATSAIDGLRRENPTISMPSFIEQGGLDQVLEQLIERAAIGGFAEKYGLRAGDNLVNSQIMTIPAFRGPDGNFDDDVYRQALSQQRLTDAQVRDDLGKGLLAQQILIPAAFGAGTPDKFAQQYASLLKERRQGSIGVIPSAAFVPEGDPTDKQLSAFYEETRGDYIRPERRTIRYIAFGDDAISDNIDPTDEEIAARYEADRDKYAPSESRTITQLIVPTPEAAAAIQKRVQSGTGLEAAAREAGLQTAKIGPITKAELTAQTSAAVANSVFAAARGTIAVPAASGLGSHVARIDGIERQPGKNLEQAKGEITTLLREEKRRRALGDLAASVEEQVEEGVSLSEVAEQLDLEITTTKPITGAGMVYGNAEERVADIVGPALQTAFQMEESEPQLAEVVPGQTFLVFETTDITESAAAPLTEIKDRVEVAWRLSEGSKAAKEAADRILKAVADGSSISAAMSAESVPLPQADTVNLTREQLAAQGRQVPPPLALMFSMAEGTVKKLEAPRDGGWFVVNLTDIDAGTIAKDDPIFAQTKAELSQTIGREYGEQLRAAISAELGVERNETAIEAVSKQLTGEN
ncbi:peptidylprolyl isomerase [Altererythrobacter sp. RZ02]|uniref:Peptidylprolyl isomerase n=1 Tax=Pontixanthobacter rizhaonensis TaxID=2730337 RepID=A0A848QPL1_9SPHN|nr:peptidylprolyl isomerase [Pontixanthobacter rizhaonensis]NMW31476.1 peptidylprolyl isomerase [Pontixanthobacter rizhaonensis]